MALSKEGMEDAYLGLFFENWTHYNSILPSLAYHARENRPQIQKLADCLFPEETASYWFGRGRSGKGALRGERNFEEGLNRLSDFAGSGLDTGPKEDDVLILVSGSLGGRIDKGKRKEIEEKFDIAKEHKMKTVVITRNTQSKIAQKSDIVITMPEHIPGEVDIKEYFKRLSSGQDGKKEPTPFEELGAVFEWSAFSFIDAFSCAFAKYKGVHFPFSTMEKKLYNSLVYMGELGHRLEDQRDLIRRLIKCIKEGTGNVYTTGFRYNTEMAEIDAIRINHEIYVRGKRKAASVDSKNFPKFNEGDILVPITGEGENEFTNYVVDEFLKKSSFVFPITYNPESRVVKKSGLENSIILPRGERYSLKGGYEIRDFEIGVLSVTDGISLSLGRTEEEMRKTHSVFS
jgi:D-arabinose 5-phosphate isomerase GutQ